MQQVQAVIDAGLVPLVVHHLSKVRSDLLGGGGGGGGGAQNTVAQLVEHLIEWLLVGAALPAGLLCCVLEQDFLSPA